MKKGTNKSHRWAIVLAAGDGTRLRSLTTDRRGVTTPKQFCSLHDGRSLLSDALDRAGRVVSRERIVTVVAEQHQRWWEAPLSSWHAGNVVVQPRNRGTAPGLLLPLLNILARDPRAHILVLPSDHYVEREDLLERATRRAMTSIPRSPERLVMLGITPDSAEPDYGWIVPEMAGVSLPMPVASFVEKPDRVAAARLMRSGAVWNSFIFAAAGAALLRLYEKRLFWLLAAFREARSSYSLRTLYEGMLPADFSRDLLQGSEAVLSVLTVPPCGWTDLGTPSRVAWALSRVPARERSGASRAVSVAPVLELSSSARVAASA